MPTSFREVVWDEETMDDCRHVVRLAIREDLDRGQDWTTVAIVPMDAQGTAQLVTREPCIAAGVPSVPLVIEEFEAQLEFEPLVTDGEALSAGQSLGWLRGSTRDLLTAERTILNLLSRLIGVATITHTFVQKIEGTGAALFDTRKTTPGFRRIEKYAVRCGGGHNHRTGLFDAVLIKDNHLAAYRDFDPNANTGQILEIARAKLKQTLPAKHFSRLVFEIEVDTLDQFTQVLSSKPDIVLLDNMSVDSLRRAVDLRDKSNNDVILEASGGMQLETVRSIAETGVDRISVGAITHSAVWADIGLDWQR